MRLTDLAVSSVSRYNPPVLTGVSEAGKPGAPSAPGADEPAVSAFGNRDLRGPGAAARLLFGRTMGPPAALEKARRVPCLIGLRRHRQRVGGGGRL